MIIVGWEVPESASSSLLSSLPHKQALDSKYVFFLKYKVYFFPVYKYNAYPL